MEQYNDLLSHVGAYLKSKGFSKRDKTFYIKECDNIGLFNFQASMGNTAEKSKFTIII